jgi:hypothetical protein
VLIIIQDRLIENAEIVTESVVSRSHAARVLGTSLQLSLVRNLSESCVLARCEVDVDFNTVRINDPVSVMF